MARITETGSRIYGQVIVSGPELGSVLGLSENRIRSLRRIGVIQAVYARKNKFEYELGPSVRGYLAFKCAYQDSPAEADFQRERSLKEAANRKLREILLEQTKNQLHRAEDLRAISADSNDQIRAQALAFSQRLARQVIGKPPDEIKSTIDAEVRLVEVRRHELRPAEVGPAEVRPQEERLDKVRRAKVRLAACSGLDAVDDKCGEPVKEHSFGIRLGEMGPP